MRTWVSCKPQKTSPARTHQSTTISSRKMAVLEDTFMSLFIRQSGGQRVLPSQDSEDMQQQFSCARPRSIKVFLPIRAEMYQTLSHFTVLQATGSWAWAWERGQLAGVQQIGSVMISSKAKWFVVRKPSAGEIIATSANQIVPPKFRNSEIPWRYKMLYYIHPIFPLGGLKGGSGFETNYNTICMFYSFQ